jgi:hypothetical protein
VQAAIFSFKCWLKADFHRRSRVPIPAQAVQQIEQRIGTFVEALVETLPNRFKGFASFDIVQSPVLCSIYNYTRLNGFLWRG